MSARPTDEQLRAWKNIEPDAIVRAVLDELLDLRTSVEAHEAERRAYFDNNASLRALHDDLIAALREALSVATRNEDGDFADRSRAVLLKAGADR
jgi:hypothetical protein